MTPRAERLAYDILLSVSVVLMAIGCLGRGRYMMGVIGGLVVFLWIVFDLDRRLRRDGKGPEADSDGDAGAVE